MPTPKRPSHRTRKHKKRRPEAPPYDSSKLTDEEKRTISLLSRQGVRDTNPYSRKAGNEDLPVAQVANIAQLLESPDKLPRKLRRNLRKMQEKKKDQT